jgi:Ca2+:H+ antiporter
VKQLFLALLLFTPLTLFAEQQQWSPLTVFLLAAVAIIPLAKYIGDATEELAARTTPAVGGLLNATFGNATELIIGIFALQAGLIEVVKASITGSIIGNLLFVLGTAMLLGGWGKEKQHFNATGAKAQGSMLLLATTALVIPAIFLATAGASSGATVEHLSVLVAVLMIVAYGANLLFSLHTHKHLYQEEEQVTAPHWSVGKSILILFLATAAVAVDSEILVGAITPLVAGFGWTELFIGVIVIAIVGNAAEHLSAITAARKSRMDLSLQISIGSATQIVMFVAPLLVLVSLFFVRPMNLVFNMFEILSILFAVFVTNSVIEDGESNWFEGFQLLVAYVIMAVAFYFHP